MHGGFPADFLRVAWHVDDPAILLDNGVEAPVHMETMTSETDAHRP